MDIPGGSKVTVDLGTAAIAVIQGNKLEITVPASQPVAIHFAPQKPPGVELRTEHYDLYVEGIDAKAVGQFTEELYATLKQFFHADPKGRLRVSVFASEQRCRDSLQYLVEKNMLSTTDADDHSPEGVYLQQTKTAYCPVHGPYRTRRAIAHECVHQFHFLTRRRSEQPQSGYYVEGIAEHFCVHRWDGQTAAFATLPALDCFRDAPFEALQDFEESHGGSFRALAIETKYPKSMSDYGGAWGLVSFLIDRHRDLYDRWSAVLDGGASPQAAWDNVFGQASDRQLSSEYLLWLNHHQERWRVLWGDWGDAGEDTLIGRGSDSEFAMAVLKTPAAELSTFIESDGATSVYLVVGYESNTAHQTVEVTPSGMIYLHKLSADEWVLDQKIVGTRVRDPKHIQFRLSKPAPQRKCSSMGRPLLRRRREVHPALASLRMGGLFSDW